MEEEADLEVRVAEGLEDRVQDDLEAGVEESPGSCLEGGSSTHLEGRSSACLEEGERKQFYFTHPVAIFMIAECTFKHEFHCMH